MVDGPDYDMRWALVVGHENNLSIMDVVYLAWRSLMSYTLHKCTCVSWAHRSSNCRWDGERRGLSGVSEEVNLTRLAVEWHTAHATRKYVVNIYGA